MRRTQHILISGRVQGVSFRFFTKSSAEKLGLMGWVRNLRDGRVEAVVQGPAEDIEELRGILVRGPLRAEVHQLEVREVFVEKEYTGFEIADDGEVPCAVKLK